MTLELDEQLKLPRKVPSSFRWVCTDVIRKLWPKDGNEENFDEKAAVAECHRVYNARGGKKNWTDETWAEQLQTMRAWLRSEDINHPLAGDEVAKGRTANSKEHGLDPIPKSSPAPLPVRPLIPAKQIERTLLDEVEVYEREQSYAEGRLGTTTKDTRNRSAALAGQARLYWMKHHGGYLVCHSCDYTVPRSVSEQSVSDILELHHTKPLSAYPQDGETLPETEAIRRLRPLCPTCHRIAHAKEGRDVFSITELRVMLGKPPRNDE